MERGVLESTWTWHAVTQKPPDAARTVLDYLWSRTKCSPGVDLMEVIHSQLDNLGKSSEGHTWLNHGSHHLVGLDGSVPSSIVTRRLTCPSWHWWSHALSYFSRHLHLSWYRSIKVPCMPVSVTTSFCLGTSMHTCLLHVSRDSSTPGLIPYDRMRTQQSISFDIFGVTIHAIVHTPISHYRNNDKIVEKYLFGNAREWVIKTRFWH